MTQGEAARSAWAAARLVAFQVSGAALPLQVVRIAKGDDPKAIAGKIAAAKAADNLKVTTSAAGFGVTLSVGDTKANSTPVAAAIKPPGKILTLDK